MSGYIGAARSLYFSYKGLPSGRVTTHASHIKFDLLSFRLFFLYSLRKKKVALFSDPKSFNENCFETDGISLLIAMICLGIACTCLCKTNHI